MNWFPKHLTREQMEERRRKGGQLLKAGKLSQAEIARRLGVSRMAVSYWQKQLQRGGAPALRSRRASGRPTRLTGQEQQQLLKQLKRGALAAGFSTAQWTMQRIRQVIQREFGVTYHVHYMSRLLTRLGWSLQQPLPRASERDEDLIQAWLSQDWPRIKKSAATRRQHRVF